MMRGVALPSMVCVLYCTVYFVNGQYYDNIVIMDEYFYYADTIRVDQEYNTTERESQ